MARNDVLLVLFFASRAPRETQDAFRTARAKLAQERAELAKTLADASARPSEDACDEISREDLAKALDCTVEELDG